MRERIKIIILTIMTLVLMIPNCAYAAEKYFYVNRAEGYSAFQEDNENQIDDGKKVMFYANGKYKYIISKDDGYLGASADGIEKDLNKALDAEITYQKGDTVMFNLFTKEYTPKEYQAMLKKATIIIFDSGNNKVDEFPLLNYKEYVQYTDSSIMNVKLNGYTGNGDINTGVDLTVSWNLKDETPQELIFKNEDAGVYQIYDISDKKVKDSVDMNIELRYNGTYTVVLTTEKSEYSKEVTFKELEDDFKKPDTQEENKYTEKNEKPDESNIKITVSGLPKNKIKDGESFTLVIETNVKTNINMNGRVDSTYQKKHKFNITENGTYTIKAFSEAGKSASKVIVVNHFKKTEPKQTKGTSRNTFWGGSVDNINNGEKLAQTGMYNYTLLIVAGVLLVIAFIMILIVVNGKKNQKKESDKKENTQTEQVEIESENKN